MTPDGGDGHVRPVRPGPGPRRRAGGTLRIGLTGPIGCGKSTIAGWLAEHGAVVIDADVVAREVVEPGEPALAAVADAFGPGVLRADGSLLRELVIDPSRDYQPSLPSSSMS